jgi:hypothetical protein
MSHAVGVEVLRLPHREKGSILEVTVPLIRGLLALEQFLSPAGGPSVPYPEGESYFFALQRRTFNG